MPAINIIAVHDQLNKTFKKPLLIQNTLLNYKLIECFQFAHDGKYVIFISYNHVHSLKNHNNITIIIP